MSPMRLKYALEFKAADREHSLERVDRDLSRQPTRWKRVTEGCDGATAYTSRHSRKTTLWGAVPLFL